MKAKMYAHSAIYKLKQDVQYTLHTLEETLKANPSKEAQHEIEDKLREKQSLLAIAYYNLGC